MGTAGQDVTAATIEKILYNPVSPPSSPLAAIGLRLDEAAIKADPAQALWLYAQMVAAGQTGYSNALAEAAAAVYVPALGPSVERSVAMPAVLDGPTFLPNDLPSYIAALKAEHPWP